MLIGSIVYAVMVVVMVGFFVTSKQHQIDVDNYLTRGVRPMSTFGYEHALKAFCLGLIWPLVLPFMFGRVFAKMFVDN